MDYISKWEDISRYYNWREYILIINKNVII